MNHLGLFEGIGGFSLAVRWMGWKTLAWCEKNEACQKVLRHHFPEAEGHGDITNTDFKKYANRIDVLTGGFPCQPFSVAGKRKGTDDERHLWPEMLRAIREIQPTWVIGENVPGLVNWDGGLAFEQMLVDLENEGYEVQPYILPACGVNAPHRRDRVWIVAYSDAAGKRRSERESKIETIVKNANSNGCGSNEREEKPSKREQRNACAGNNERICANNGEAGFTRYSTGKGLERGKREDEQRSKPGSEKIGAASNSNDLNRRSGAEGQDRPETCNHCEPVTADTYGFGLRGQIDRYRKPGLFNEDGTGGYWEDFPTQSPVCNGNDGLPLGLAGITFSKWRRQSLEQMGNAIVPDVAYQIFQAIEQFEK